MKKKIDLRNSVIFLVSILFISIFLLFLFENEKYIAINKEYKISEEEISDYIKFSKFQYYELFSPEEWISISKTDKQKEILVKNTINNVLLYKIKENEIKKNGITFSDKEINKYMEMDENNEFKNKLRNYNISENFLKNHIKNLLVEQSYKKNFLKRVNVSNKEIEKYYIKNKNDFIIKKVRMYQIWIKKSKVVNGENKNPKKLAYAAYEELKNGKDFKIVCDKYSQDDRNLVGGDIGYVDKNTVLSQLRDTLDMDEGIYSKPIKTKEGYFIVKVGDKKVITKTLNESNHKIKEKIKEKKYEEQEKNILKENSININKNKLKKMYDLF
ncbi:peptidylprolyl isomerase [Peptostreptococcus canis]|uniref:PpiC domain-containing protein n=1 Tax=Peptostreptococcus canis TaxID=1159213 RepID=A0ABR6TL06_9FIRM|nr:peptidylprolyl isomerase [Peptostreptococcus canis]MBC2576094.1 hypothetical protein [Peptostreptococcus canis]MBP1997780.1 foldase protein PrsA [Peptostreptococcus canis]